jgi:NADP-dependent 3-hydroxy acid dehydrogenase YdfG
MLETASAARFKRAQPMHINGSLVLITGASSGIGAATAKAIAQAGGKPILVARTKPVLDAAAAEIRAAGGQAWAYAADLSDAVEVARATVQIAREAGLPDIIINSTGAGRWLFVDETSAEEAAQMMAAPYFTAFYTTRAFLPGMLQRGSGQIVNINSPVSRFVWPGAAGYAAARWALRGFSEALRADRHATGLRVTAVVPGLVLSPYFDHNPGAFERVPKIARLMPSLTPKQVAGGIVWAVEHDRREHVMPFMLRLFFVMHSLAPWLVEALLLSTGWKRPGQQAEKGSAEA